MSVGAFALRQRTLVVLTLMVLTLAGVIAGRGLPSGIYPEVDFPRIGVKVHQGDAPPDVFEASITRPVEAALASVLGVQRVRSRSIRGAAEIQLQFAPSTDMWRALQLAQASVADVRGALPADTAFSVTRLTPVAFPILSFNVSGPQDPRVVREVAEFTLVPAISRVAGVGGVGVVGGDVREVEVLVDPDRAAAAHLGLMAIADRVRQQTPLESVGWVEQDHALNTVFASAEPTMDNLPGLPLSYGARGLPLRLQDVADVVEGAEDRTLQTEGRDGDAVLLSIARMEGASTPDVVQAVLDAVEALRPTLPPGLVVEPVYDQGNLVEASVASIRDAIFVGIALCLIVLGVFLGDVRAGLVAGLAVPTTLAMTFLGMHAMGHTLNLMSLGGMAVAIGLVVDDAIVVVEAIARRLEAGVPPEQAAQEGTDELAAAVVGTTITTVIVFLPLAFLQGVVGSFFGALAGTLSIAVGLSLLVALFVVPVAAARFMRPRKTVGANAPAWVDYLVRASATHPLRWPLIVAAILVAFIGVAAGQVPSGFMPACDEGAFVIDYETPAGTSLAETDRAARAMGQILRDTPEVVNFSRRTGAQLGPAEVTLVTSGDFVVRLAPLPRRSADDIIAEIRSRIEREVPAVRTEFIQMLQDMLNDLSGAPHPIEIKVFGSDQVVLEGLGEELAHQIEGVEGAVDVFSGVEDPSPQIDMQLDRDAITRLGLLPETISREVHAALTGVMAGQMRFLDRWMGIRVHVPDRVRRDPQRLARMPLASGSADGGAQAVVLLGQVASMVASSAPTERHHENLQPVVIVSADHEGRDLGSVARDVRALVEALPLPNGVHVEIGGQVESQAEAERNLTAVAGGGLLLLLVVLVAQFGSLRPALAILVTAPLSLAGALGALWLTHTPLDASSMMGCVLLVGLAVKNGILLLEVAEEHARTVPYDEALVLAARRRLRPILMTTLSTLAGLAPLAAAIGAGSELQQPLAIAVIGGLTLSMGVSLVVLPGAAAWLARGGFSGRRRTST